MRGAHLHGGRPGRPAALAALADDGSGATGDLPALRVVITGVTGQVGSTLVPLARAAGFAAIPADRRILDLADPAGLARRLDDLAPDILVNPAAYTAVDRAESEPDLARRINAEAPAALARWCVAHGVPLVHLSTDYVFSGQPLAPGRPWRDDDPVAPLNVYGATKADGEAAIRAAGASALILRTAWVYAARGRNFLTTMLRLGRERPVLRVVADQEGTPTAATTLARALVVVLERLRATPDPAARAALMGTYHLTDAGQTTWCGFARAIFAEAGRRWPGPWPVVEAITTADYPTPARRPAWSVLETGRFQRVFGFVPPPWQASLAESLDTWDGMAGAAGPDSPPRPGPPVVSPKPEEPS